MKLSKDDIFFINAFQSETGVAAKDCVSDGNTVSFLVEKQKMGKAIGKNGVNIKNMGKKFKKTVEILGFFESVEKFIKEAFNKFKIEKVEINNDGEKKILIHTDKENKMNILRNKKRFERIKNFTIRNYSINEIRLR